MILPEALTLFALTVASAFCSSSEIAFFSLPASRLKSYLIDSNPKKQLIAKLLQNSTSLLVTIFMLNTIVNILLQNSASHLFDQFQAGWLLKVGFPLVLVLIFGELAPKYFGLIYNEQLAKRYVATINFLQKITTPLRVILTSISSVISRMLFFFLKAEPPLSTKELEHILASSEGKGLVHRDETACILGVMTLDQKQVRELMLPKTQMPIYNISEPLSKLIYLFSEYPLDEIPVIEQHDEKLLGTISAKIFFIERPHIASGQDLLPLLQKPFFVPETTSAKALLQQFGEKDLSQALVIDEYGQMTGVITELDLVEQIARAANKTTIDEEGFRRVAKDAIIAPGTLSLDDITSLFNIELTSTYHQVTIGGWLIEQLGHIPKSTTTYQYKTLFFRILAADPTKINKVYIQSLTPQLEQKGAKS